MEKAAPAPLRPAPGRTGAPGTPSSRNRMTVWKKIPPWGPFPPRRVARRAEAAKTPSSRGVQTRTPIWGFDDDVEEAHQGTPPKPPAMRTSTFERLVVTLTFVMRARKASTGKPLASAARAHPGISAATVFSRWRNVRTAMDSPPLTAVPRLTKSSSSLRSAASQQAHRLCARQASTGKPIVSAARAHGISAAKAFQPLAGTYAQLMGSPHLTAMPRLTQMLCKLALRSFSASPSPGPRRRPEEPRSLRQQGRSTGHQDPSRTHYPLEGLQHSPPTPSTPQTPRVTRSTLPRGTCKRTRRHLCGLKRSGACRDGSAVPILVAAPRGEV